MKNLEHLEDITLPSEEEMLFRSTQPPFKVGERVVCLAPEIYGNRPGTYEVLDISREYTEGHHVWFIYLKLSSMIRKYPAHQWGKANEESERR